MSLVKTRDPEVRTYSFHDDSDFKRGADITIRFINDEGLKNTGYWEFVKCDFTTSASVYKLEDWEFLSMVNAKIKELIK